MGGGSFSRNGWKFPNLLIMIVAWLVLAPCNQMSAPVSLYDTFYSRTFRSRRRTDYYGRGRAGGQLRARTSYKLLGFLFNVLANLRSTCPRSFDHQGAGANKGDSMRAAVPSIIASRLSRNSGASTAIFAACWAMLEPVAPHLIAS